MPSPAAGERAALVALLEDTGPDAPTLCGDWTTHDLAAHLVVRDSQPLALPGLVVPVLHAVTAAYERRARRRPYDDLVAALRTGPPPLSPAQLGDLAELHEWYVHHEDVRRRVAPGTRATSAALQDGLWARLAVLGPVLALRAHGLGLVLATPDGRRRRVRRGGAETVLTGEPGELLLWMFGRKAAADVHLWGSPDAVALAGRARVGF